MSSFTKTPSYRVSAGNKILAEHFVHIAREELRIRGAAIRLAAQHKGGKVFYSDERGYLSLVFPTTRERA